MTENQVRQLVEWIVQVAGEVAEYTPTEVDDNLVAHADALLDRPLLARLLFASLVALLRRLGVTIEVDDDGVPATPAADVVATFKARYQEL